jgi:hypothetical protein
MGASYNTIEAPSAWRLLPGAMNTRRWRFDARGSDLRIRREHSSLDTIAPLKISVCGIEELAGQCEAGVPAPGSLSTRTVCCAEAQQRHLEHSTPPTTFIRRMALLRFDLVRVTGAASWLGCSTACRSILES